MDSYWKMVHETGQEASVCVITLGSDLCGRVQLTADSATPGQVSWMG